jgi:UDP-N-acetylglucosamine--N-acetylmuramyl-(pentapeptide) pyrophosphoryl-undecaprenol N-acetylglucosamine transferase
MGGLISSPVCLAGKLLQIPIEIWELNVEPGKTVKFLTKFVDTINICFDETQKYLPHKTCKLVDYPIRFNDESKKILKISILEKNNFLADKKTILIIGGSQGSQFINNLFKQFILKNLQFKEKIQVIHQTGSTEFDWNKFYKMHNINAITFNFYDKMDEYYSISDLVICRSGAGTLAEIQFFEKKCITIPLETKSTSHQILNANNLAKRFPESFKVIKQNESFETFEKHIKNLVNF